MSTRGANGRFLVEAHPTFQCEQCGVAFWRKRAGMGHTYRDAFRFCSKQCWGARQTALAAPRIQAARAAKRVERELTQVMTAELHQALAAALPHTTHGKRWETNRHRQVPHVCPDCGAAFQAVARRVYCSRRCARRFRKMQSRGHYPTLAASPVIERNQLSSMLSDVRAVQRMLWSQ